MDSVVPLLTSRSLRSIPWSLRFAEDLWGHRPHGQGARRMDPDSSQGTAAVLVPSSGDLEALWFVQLVFKMGGMLRFFSFLNLDAKFHVLKTVWVMFEILLCSSRHVSYVFHLHLPTKSCCSIRLHSSFSSMQQLFFRANCWGLRLFRRFSSRPLEDLLDTETLEKDAEIPRDWSGALSRCGSGFFCGQGAAVLEQ